MAEEAKAPSPFPVDTSPALLALIRRYKDEGPLHVSFRTLVSWLKVTERATHYLHPYPAKLLPQIAHFFLAAHSLSGRKDIVLDPFCGSGTVPLEAMLSGRRVYFADANPMALLITRAKTQWVSQASIKGATLRVERRYLRSRLSTPPDVVNIDLWYDRLTVGQLCRLKSAIDKERESPTKRLLQVTLSATARKVSLAMFCEDLQQIECDPSI